MRIPVPARHKAGRFFNTGTEVLGSSPGELGAVVKAEMARMGKVIKDAGIRAD